jgi:hypothetical protein
MVWGLKLVFFGTFSVRNTIVFWVYFGCMFFKSGWVVLQLINQKGRYKILFKISFPSGLRKVNPRVSGPKKVSKTRPNLHLFFNLDHSVYVQVFSINTSIYFKSTHSKSKIFKFKIPSHSSSYFLLFLQILLANKAKIEIALVYGFKTPY